MGKVKEEESEVMFHKDRFEENYLNALLKYHEAYHILMDYWDLLPDEEKKESHKRLEKIGL